MATNDRTGAFYKRGPSAANQSDDYSSEEGFEDYDFDDFPEEENRLSPNALSELSSYVD